MSPRRAAGNRPCLVELVGPAGAGKTTLAAALRVVEPALASGPGLWGLPLRDLATGAGSLLPMFLSAALRGRPYDRAEMAQMIRLEALCSAVARAQAGGRPLVLDEGPVFALSWLEVHYANGHDPARTAWRRRMLAEWAFRLDAVVRMDVDDAAIAYRIRTRTKPHQVKHAPDEEIRDFTARFRDAFDRVLAGMAACSAVAVHYVPSSDGAVSDDAVRVRDAIAQALSEH